ncbi:MAG: hypothetical protein M3N08_04905 [Pseudomonadota bacterium]|nr:hypothetical protein [Pseudomonadota bacterium]
MRRRKPIGEFTKLLLIICVTSAVFAAIAVKVYKTEHAPERVLNAVVEPMVTDMANAKWNGQVLTKYSTPEFRQWLLDNNHADGMPGFSYLGKVKKYIGMEQLEAHSDFATLTADFQFEAGPGSVTLQLSQRGGRWLIYSFKVESPLFHPVPTAPHG